ncbi:MAG: hypothetical protein AAF065_10580 [Verrucomicrobiota bacterium]
MKTHSRTQAKLTKFLVGISLIALASPALGLVNISLSGTTEYEGWSDLNGTNFPGPVWPDSISEFEDAWGAPVGATDVGSANNAFIFKVGGGGYFASESIYSHTSPGQFVTVNSAPLAGLETVVFQIEALGGFIAEPTLTILDSDSNDLFTALPADFTATSAGDPIDFGGTTVNQFQWDLSGLDLSGMAEYQLFYIGSPFLAQSAFQLDSGTVFTQVVPEPSIFAVLFGIVAFNFAANRRRRS